MEHMLTTTYDYIIAGAGCAGLSLLYRMLRNENLCNSKILVVDRKRKSSNDRTWCFWEKSEDVFQSLVCKEWETLCFHSDVYSDSFSIHPYRYKMIRSQVFYKQVQAFAQKFDNVTFVCENTVDIYHNGTMPELETNKNAYQAKFIFNSTNILCPEIEYGQNALLMHFKGWFVKTQHASFDPQKATLMDFDVDQQGATAFMYIMPLSPYEALVEYTVIGKQSLKTECYNKVFKHYITQKLAIDKYTVTHTERGCIPMSKKCLGTKPKRNIIPIGTAGDCVKASSGYAFQFIQAQTKLIVDKLSKQQSPIPQPTLMQSRFRVYDKTFIRVMQGNKMSGQQLMGEIFKHNSPANVMAFLANESELAHEYEIMKNLPAHIFLPAALMEVI